MLNIPLMGGGKKWRQVGNGLTISHALIFCDLAPMTATRIALAINGDATNSIQAYDWDGADWTSEGNPQGISGPGGPAMAGLSSGRVAHWDFNNDSLRAYDYSAPNWSATGSGLSISTNGFVTLTGLDSGSVALFDTLNDSLRKYSFNGSTWSLTGSGLSIGQTLDCSLATLSSSRVALYNEAGKLQAYDFSGSAWSSVGNPSPEISVLTSGDRVDIAALSSTQVAVVDDKTGILRTMEFDGTDWAEIGKNITISGMSDMSIVALNSKDIAYYDLNNDELRTYRFS